MLIVSKPVKKLCLLLFLWLFGLGCGAALRHWWPASSSPFWSPLGELVSTKPDRPLQKYALPELEHWPLTPRQLTITSVLRQDDQTTALLFIFNPLGKKMSGQITLPTAWLKNPPETPVPVILMARGYVPLEIYETGVGTRNAATQYAKAGFLTVAPDFFGFGDSEPEPTDSWQARFEKPVIMMELYRSLQTSPLNVPSSVSLDSQPHLLQVGTVGLWGHSNGGQIVLAMLEGWRLAAPTTLWAPVTAPFPYSILFFSDESPDEGKGMRRWLSQFEDTYDVFDFSLSQHLDRLQAPLQLHHGTADEAALTVWSDEFVAKITAENKLRAAQAASASTAATASAEIELLYHQYPGADHNLQPGWQTVVDRDLVFFNQHLKK